MMKAISSRLEGIASRLEAIVSRLEGRAALKTWCLDVFSFWTCLDALESGSPHPSKIEISKGHERSQDWIGWAL